MKNAIIIHGTTELEEILDPQYPSQSNSHWIPWLQKQLIIKGYDCQTPEMPNPTPFKYEYDMWKKMLERFEINENSVLIGHSTGTGFLLRYLSEVDTKIDKLILLAPYLDPFKEESSTFFEFELDKNLNSKTNSIHALYSLNDSKSVLKSTEILKESDLDIKYLEFKNKGHFTFSDLGTNAFPELLKMV